MVVDVCCKLSAQMCRVDETEISLSEAEVYSLYQTEYADCWSYNLITQLTLNNLIVFWIITECTNKFILYKLD